MKEKTVMLPVAPKQKIAAYCSLPQAKTFPLLICHHGLFSNFHREVYLYLRDHLVPKGWAVLGFDFRGHGKSSGDVADITIDQSVADMRAAVRYARTIPGMESLSFFGRSYGGMIAIIAAIENPDALSLGLSSPVIDYAAQNAFKLSPQELRSWREKQLYPYTRFDGSVVQLNFRFYRSMQTYEGKLCRLAPKINASTFIVHGEKDKQASLKLTKEFYDVLRCDKELVVVPNADHYFSTQKQRTNLERRFVDFFTQTA